MVGGVGCGMAECSGRWTEELRKFQGRGERDREREMERKRREKRWAR